LTVTPNRLEQPNISRLCGRRQLYRRFFLIQQLETLAGHKRPIVEVLGTRLPLLRRYPDPDKTQAS
jgi:hypothetical protein